MFSQRCLRECSFTVWGTSPESTELSLKWFQERTPPTKGAVQTIGDCFTQHWRLQFFGQPSVLWLVHFTACPRGGHKRWKTSRSKALQLLPEEAQGPEKPHVGSTEIVLKHTAQAQTGRFLPLPGGGDLALSLTFHSDSEPRLQSTQPAILLHHGKLYQKVGSC